MPKLKAPENSTGCSFNGTNYDIDKNGVVDVPDAAVPELVAHGFRPLPAEQPKK